MYCLSIPRWYDWNQSELANNDAVANFQFHDGTIGTFVIPSFFGGFVDFQFHDGTIGTPQYVPLCDYVSCFQFHDGTIGTPLSTNFAITPLLSIPRWYDWNPRRTGAAWTCRTFQFHDGTIGTHVEQTGKFPVKFFQFHDGTIGTSMKNFISRCVKNFQFHDGTIGTTPNISVSLRTLSFNSTMVRLEPYLSVYP